MTEEAPTAVSDAALSAVYRAQLDFVWRLTRSLGVAPHEVDDVVHDVFLVVRRRLPERRTDVPLRAWLARITHNVVLHHHRARARLERRLQRIEPPVAVRTPAELHDDEEAAALVQAFLDRLEERKREVFVLVEIEGMTLAEVSRILDVKRPTVFSRLKAARDAFEAYVARLSAREARVMGGMR